MLDLWSPPANSIGNKRDHQKYEKDKEQNFCNTCRCTRDTPKTKDTGNNGYDETDYSPIKHNHSSLFGFHLKVTQVWGRHKYQAAAESFLCAFYLYFPGSKLCFY